VARVAPADLLGGRPALMESHGPGCDRVVAGLRCTDHATGSWAGRGRSSLGRQCPYRSASLSVASRLPPV
jgi:hypothetical protein